MERNENEMEEETAETTKEEPPSSQTTAAAAPTAEVTKEDGSTSTSTAKKAATSSNRSTTMSRAEREAQEQLPKSVALAAIVRNPEIHSDASEAIEDFFSNVWQARPRLYRNEERQSDSGSGGPLEEALDMGMEGIATLLDKARQRCLIQDETQLEDRPPPLFFRDLRMLSLNETYEVYQHSPFAAYLDGCSVVVNHADLSSAEVATLCMDLQQSFPHCYANTYLTPPRSQAVPPHADDRDVLILQVYGKKMWRVYKSVPVAYPYSHEQVGKPQGIPLPPSVLRGDLLINETLTVGDVLYIPRGYVHEAACGDEASFHITIAIATHDWSLAHVMTDMICRSLDGLAEYRKAVNVKFGTQPDDTIPKRDVQALQDQIQSALQLISQEAISVRTISNALRLKYATHNDRALVWRTALLREAAADEISKMMVPPSSLQPGGNGTNVIVGPEAAKRVMWMTVVRASTPEERASVVVAPPGGAKEDSADKEETGTNEKNENETTTTPPPPPDRRGFTVREECLASLMTILQKLKAEKGMEMAICHLRSLLPETSSSSSQHENLDDFTLYSFVRCCVELGALAICCY